MGQWEILAQDVYPAIGIDQTLGNQNHLFVFFAHPALLINTPQVSLKYLLNTSLGSLSE
jgi:hypothetical protein